MALPTIRGDYRVIETYPATPERTVGCPITVLVGDAPKTTVAEAQRWLEHTTGAFLSVSSRGG